MWCRALALSTLKLRTHSFPFDWIAVHPKIMLDILKDDFKWFDAEGEQVNKYGIDQIHHAHLPKEEGKFLWLKRI